MKFSLVLCASFLMLTSMVAQADTLVTGTPIQGSLSPQPKCPTPCLAGLYFNFDSLTPGSTFSSSTYASQGVTIISPDGLLVEPFSTESGPNDLQDNSTAGTANISIDLTTATNIIGVGIEDSDGTYSGATFTPVNIMLQALNKSGVAFGSVFTVTLSETTNNPGNGYFLVEDTTADIYGVQITQTVANAALFSGLAIDDLQVATPEPSSFLLAAAGIAIFGFIRLRKLA